MVDFCGRRNWSTTHYFTNGEFPGNKSGDSKSGEEFENGINEGENLKMKIKIICWFTI
jgi:hypothetical protein